MATGQPTTESTEHTEIPVAYDLGLFSVASMSSVVDVKLKGGARRLSRQP